MSGNNFHTKHNRLAEKKSKSCYSTLMNQYFNVGKQYKPSLKIIPYIGCKAGFAHIFDVLIPDIRVFNKKIYDLFGGGGGFTFYACNRFGSKNVVYNDHNPVIINFMKSLKKKPNELIHQYQKHHKASNPDYYLDVRDKDLEDDIIGAGRFFYLAKNAFSGKIRFNSKNKFNSPMRKNTKCPQINQEAIKKLSVIIKHLKITRKDFMSFEDVKNNFVYLDPPYLNNTNGHYNSIVEQTDFIEFVKNIETSNKIMISEQNTPEYLKLSPTIYQVFKIKLNRSLQYFTQKDSSREIIAINYKLPKNHNLAEHV